MNLDSHYGGEFVKEPFRKNGISYEVCNQPKSDLFRDMLPLLNSGHISLPRHDRTRWPSTTQQSLRGHRSILRIAWSPLFALVAEYSALA